MANFDTSLSNDSTIQYGYNNTAFVVQWSNVMLKDKNPDGKFTFQIILLDNGDIVFVYKDIPFSIDTIPDKSHPVKVGISDAYVIDKTVFCKNEFYLVFHVLFFHFCSHSKEDYL